MRKTITWEGEEKVPGVIIEKGALTWNEPVPIASYSNFRDLEDIVGNARDLRREEDGRITAELDLFDETDTQKHAKIILENGDMTTTIWANQVAESRDTKTGKRHVFAADIKSIFLVLIDQVGWD